MLAISASLPENFIDLLSFQRDSALHACTVELRFIYFALALSVEQLENILESLLLLLLRKEKHTELDEIVKGELGIATHLARIGYPTYH